MDGDMINKWQLSITFLSLIQRRRDIQFRSLNPSIKSVLRVLLA